MRFGIGDKVLVKPSLAPGGEIVVKDKPQGVKLTDAMRKFANKIVTIKDKTTIGFFDCFLIEEDGGADVWWDTLFLPVPDHVQKHYKGRGPDGPSVTLEEMPGQTVEYPLKRNDDPVAHPAHYTYGKIEVIDFIQDKDLNFALGNAVKYIVRAGHKAEQGMSDEEKAIQDLEKAKQYIDFEIEHRKGVRGCKRTN